MMAGTTAPGSNPLGANTPSAVQLFSKAMGHLGGNMITAEFKNPGVASSPLSVAVTGNDIVVNLATGADGALTSTAAQVRDAINANPAASALVTAHTVAGNAGAGHRRHARRSTGSTKRALSDYLAAPAARPARAVRHAHAPDRQAARRHQDRRLHLLPAARP